jgi:hypothetical protein
MQQLCSKVQRQEIVQAHFVHKIQPRHEMVCNVFPKTHLISKDDILVAGPRESKLVQSRQADIRAVFDPRRGGNWAA